MSRSEIIFEVVESPEGGYEAHAVGESIFTEADTRDQLRENVREAVRCYFFDASTAPSIIRLHFVN
jgi:hypothetical protein